MQEQGYLIQIKIKDAEYLYPAKSNDGFSSNSGVNNLIVDRDGVINDHMCAFRIPSSINIGTCMLNILMMMMMSTTN